MKTKSEFSEWFLAQYGARPGGDATTNELMRAAVNASRTFERARATFEERLKYDRRETAARYAWNAALNPKPKAWRKR